MAETSSLLNCRTGSRTGGSNPPPSAGVTLEDASWSVHLTVRIQDSQSWHKGSIPLPTTSKLRQRPFSGRFFVLVSQKESICCWPKSRDDQCIGRCIEEIHGLVLLVGVTIGTTKKGG